MLAKVLERYSYAPDGVEVVSAFREISGVEDGVLSLAAIKLERLGYLDRSISDNGQYDYFTFSITADGIDYLLENEELLHQANSRSKQKSSDFENFDDDIPF